MTVTTTINLNQYAPNGLDDSFAYLFRVLDSSHMKVYFDGVLQGSGGYTVENVGQNLGTVDFITPPPDTVAVLTLIREVPIDQLVDYEPYDPFPAETHEGALDKLTMISQQHEELLDRAALGPPGVLNDFILNFGSAPDRAGKLWAFDPTGLIVIPKDSAEDLAYRWAETDEGIVVENRAGRDRYSAYHWAQKAEAISGLPLAAVGDILSHDGSGYSVVSQASLGGVDGDLLVIDSTKVSGFNYATPQQQLPVILAGDKLKLLKVKVDETGYELTENYGDNIVHPKDMLEDDASDSPVTITAYLVPHYNNVAMLFENPGGAGNQEPQCWINGLFVRRHDLLSYRLRIRVSRSIGDANTGDVVFRAQAFIYPPNAPLNPTGLAPVTSAAVTIPVDTAGIDVSFPALIPLDASVPNVMASISIKRLATGNTYIGQADLVIAELEIE